MSESAGPVAHAIVVRRTARYYTVGTPVTDVWFLLHGVGQLASTFLGYFSDLNDGSRFLVAPEGLSRYYTVPPTSMPPSERPVGASWMTRDDREHEIEDYVAYLDAVYRALSPTWPPGIRVRVVGFSQGAATATRWVTQGTVRANELILWGGLLPPETDLTHGAAVFRGASLTLVVGDRDRFVSADAVAQERRRLGDAHIDHRYIGFTGGHAISRAALKELSK